VQDTWKSFKTSCEVSPSLESPGSPTGFLNFIGVAQAWLVCRNQSGLGFEPGMRANPPAVLRDVVYRIGYFSPKEIPRMAR